MSKVEQLSRANDDMKNLLNGSEIATIFLDNQLRIKRYTERAKEVIRLIPTDVGRPIADLVSNLRYDRLVEDAQEVLRTLTLKEAEVRCDRGTWYLMRLLPYRTGENVVDGLVITLVEITKLKLLQDAALRGSRPLALSSISVFTHDEALRYVWASGNPFGLPSAAIVGKTDAEVFPSEQAAALVELKRRALESPTTTYERVHWVVRGEAAEYDVFLEHLPAGSGDDVMVGICAAVRAAESNPRATGSLK